MNLPSQPGKDPTLRAFLRSMALEMLIYAPVVVVYLLLVMRFGTGLLVRLFHESPVAYTIAGFAAIVAQGVLLDLLASWLLRKVGTRQ